MPVRADFRTWRLAVVEEVTARVTKKLYPVLVTIQRRGFRRLLKRFYASLPGDLKVALNVRAEDLSWLEATIKRLAEEVISEFVNKELDALLQEYGLLAEPVIKEIADEALMRAGFIPEETLSEQIRQALEDLAKASIFISLKNHLTSPEVLTKAILEARERGGGLRAAEAAIMRIGGYRWWEAERVARTTFTAASGKASLEAIRAAGYEWKRWVATKDERVRGYDLKDKHDHLHMDGQVVRIEEPFRDPRSGELLLYPGDTSWGAEPGEVINCRCTIVGAGRPDKKAADEAVAQDLPPPGEAEKKELIELSQKLAQIGLMEERELKKLREALDKEFFDHSTAIDKRDILSDWTATKSSSRTQRFIREAIRRVIYGQPPKGQTYPDWPEAIKRMYDTLRERLKRVFEHFSLGHLPKRFALYRGFVVDKDWAAELLKTWASGGEIKPVATLASSWSFSPLVAQRFAKPRFNQVGFVLRIYVPLDHLLATFLTDSDLGYSDELEAIVLRAADFGASKNDVSVVLPGSPYVYTFKDRDKVLKLFERIMQERSITGKPVAWIMDRGEPIGGFDPELRKALAKKG